MIARKSILAAALVATVATPALAGGYEEPYVAPMITPDVIVEEAKAQASSVGPEMVVILMTLAVFSAAAGN